MPVAGITRLGECFQLLTCHLRLRRSGGPACPSPRGATLQCHTLTLWMNGACVTQVFPPVLLARAAVFISTSPFRTDESAAAAVSSALHIPQVLYKDFNARLSTLFEVSSVLFACCTKPAGVV